MPTLFIDSSEVRSLIRGNNRRDPRITECWDGVIVVPPIRTIEHQGIVAAFTTAFGMVLGMEQAAKVRPGVNVSDRAKGWKKNYRCPDVVVYYPENPAINHETHWEGGPDFAVEILSKGEDPSAKFEFYAAVGTRELLIVDRKPWVLELFRLINGSLVSVGRSTPADHAVLKSEVIPFAFRMGLGDPRAWIEIENTGSGQLWKA